MLVSNSKSIIYDNKNKSYIICQKLNFKNVVVKTNKISLKAVKLLYRQISNILQITKAIKMKKQSIMKHLNQVLSVLLVSTLLFAFTSDKKEVSSWQVDKAHSSVNFEIIHIFTPVHGTFDEFGGDIMFSPDDLENSKVDFSIDVASVNTKNEKRDGHLQSEDFFNAKKWPKMNFKASKFEKKGKGKFVAHGKLTIKDVTKDFDLPFEVLGIRDHPMRKDKKLMGLRAEATIDRTDYNVGVGDWAATAVVGDEVDITINIEALADK